MIQGCTGTAWSADSGLCQEGCPRHLKSLHFWAAENRYPPSQKVTLEVMQQSKPQKAGSDLLSPPAQLCGASFPGPRGMESPPERRSCHGPTAAPEGRRTRTRALGG